MGHRPTGQVKVSGSGATVAAVGVIYTIPGILALSHGTATWTPASSGTITAIGIVAGTAPQNTGGPSFSFALLMQLKRNGTVVRSIGIANGSNFGADFTPISYAAGDHFTIDIIEVGSAVPGADVTITFNLA
jgi:hypothetical protein